MCRSQLLLRPSRRAAWRPPQPLAAPRCFSHTDERIPAKRKWPSRRRTSQPWRRADRQGGWRAAVVRRQSHPWEEGVMQEGAIVSSAVFIRDIISASSPNPRQTMNAAFVVRLGKKKKSKTRKIFFPRISAQQRSSSGDINLLQFKRGGGWKRTPNASLNSDHAIDLLSTRL